MAAKASLYDKADKHIRKWAGTLGAIATILASVAGMCAWASSQFARAVSEQISSFQQEVREADKKTEVQITRLELMTLIDTQPNNVAEIEKVAKHYFKDLEADWYMTSIYSDWAKEYGGDVNLIIGVD